MRREFLQLANKFKMGKHSPAGMWVSEKLDGARVFWDGGITRGMATTSVPWSNIWDPKKPGELKKKIKPVATGLWSRYGNPIMAPDWWLNQLPKIFIDGELFAGRGNFQTLRSIVSKDIPEEDRWQNVKLAAFGSPSPEQVFAPGEIKNPNFHLQINPSLCFKHTDLQKMYKPATFEEELIHLQNNLTGGLCYLHEHTKLPDDKAEAEDHLFCFMDTVLDAGGEGIMLRKPGSVWTPKRVSTLLKLKPFTDDQATITGFVSGRETDKGSKLRGLIGAIVTDYKGKRLELSGFTNEERLFATDAMQAYAYENPGKLMPADFQGRYFKLGDTIEFRYRELSDEGIPKEARFYRRV